MIRMMKMKKLLVRLLRRYDPRLCLQAWTVSTTVDWVQSINELAFYSSQQKKVEEAVSTLTTVGGYTASPLILTVSRTWLTSPLADMIVDKDYFPWKFRKCEDYRAFNIKQKYLYGFSKIFFPEIREIPELQSCLIQATSGDRTGKGALEGTISVRPLYVNWPKQHVSWRLVTSEAPAVARYLNHSERIT